MREQVRGYADAVLDGLKDKDAREASAQLRAFSDLLAGSSDLRGAFALPTTSPGTRRAIVVDLLHKKASPHVVALLAYGALSGGGSDFAEDAVQLASIAEAKAQGLVPLYTGPLGRKSAGDRVAGYATAVLAPVTDDRRLSNIEDELFRFMRIVEGNDELRVALGTNEVPVGARRHLVGQLLDLRAAGETSRMARYACAVGRPRDYLDLLAALVDQVASEAERRVADVRSAVEMTDAQQRRLGAALAKLTGTAVDVRVTVEAALLGGFVATVGDTVVDASVRHRLSQVRDLLTAPTLAPSPGQQTARGQESN